MRKHIATVFAVIFWIVLVASVIAAVLAGALYFLDESIEYSFPVLPVLPEKASAYGTMDEEGVFHIYSDEDWLAFLEYVKSGEEDLDVLLEVDVTMRAGYAIEKYSGHLDGQGYRIEVSTFRRALFDCLETGGFIENLTLEVNIRPRKNLGSGGIVNYNYGTIRACEVYGTVTGYDYTGGIAENNLGLIEDCNNYAAVTSLETGETWRKSKSWMDGYGAGGIAGFCGTTKREENIPEECAIINCCNYGDVTAEVYAGGIVVYLKDRTSESAPSSSVQEMVQYDDFVTPSEDISEREEEQLQPEREPEQHYSLSNCTNYGTVTVNQRIDTRTYWYTQPAGICADLNWGDIFRCVNRGKVRFAESAPKYHEDGTVYQNRPMAITENIGFAPTRKHHIIECVNLKGTIDGTMRHENILELSEEELLAWEAGTYAEEYVSNNWEFDLEEAVNICGLEPLGISESTGSAGRNNYYLCEDFALFLPDYLEIQEVCLPDEEGSACYALHIRVAEEISEETLSEKTPTIGWDEECYILRKTADVQTALAQAQEEDLDREEWFMRYFIHKVYGTISSCRYLKISSLNPPFDDTYRARYVDGKRIYMEGAIPDESLYTYMQEGGHKLGNAIAMPLEGVSDEGISSDLSAKWLFVFTRRGTNIHPSRVFMERIETGFYPLEGDEKLYTVREGDTLWNLASDCTGNAMNWGMLADLNGISDPDAVFPGDTLILPSKEAWEKKVERLSREWIYSYEDLPESGEPEE